MSDRDTFLAADGAGTPPRLNGELIFDAPWQSRAFGMAAALADSGRLDWTDFQSALIDQVAYADSAGADTAEPTVYWRCWLDALGGLVPLDGAELAARSAQIAAAWSHH